MKSKYISEHITYNESIKSSTAIRKGIKNIPTEYELQNMGLVAEKVFEPLREWVKGPIKITSFFRCEELNKTIGGSSKSQHCEGRAIDVDDIYNYKSNAEMFHFIKNNLNFDQLIWEYGNSHNPDWVHLSFISETQNRQRVLQAFRVNNKTEYKII
jgi:hypothetical protein|tara:strand:- start:1095 stop:1562 length:468 start_codon:yes stop_codon:yes gene_type:complete